MWPFRRRTEQKASSVGALVSAFSLRRPIWQQRNFGQLAKEGYQQNVVVYACVWLTSLCAASIPIKIVQGDGEVDAPDLQALLDRPNPVTDGIDYRQAIIADYLLGGNAYCERVDVSGKPRELYRWRPDRTTIVPGPQGWPAAYEYSIGGAKRRLDIDPLKGVLPILHFRDYSPIDDWYGMSPLDPAAFAVDAHTGAERWNKALLDNSACPSGALVYAPTTGPTKLADDQFSRLKEELEQAYSGAKRAGKPMLLDGGMSWTAMGLSPKEMDWTNGKMSSARDIALAIGVPPLLLGLPGDNTFANYTEANKAFYRQTVLPVLQRLCRAWSWWLCPAFGKGLSLDPDIDDLPVFADERAAQWDRIEKSSTMTVNEKRQAQGLPDVEGGDVILVSSLLTPLSSIGERVQGGPAPFGDGKDPEEDATSQKRRRLRITK